jgi:hypothetical protein
MYVQTAPQILPANRPAVTPAASQPTRYKQYAIITNYKIMF